jgi:hypothetical protein
MDVRDRIHPAGAVAELKQVAAFDHQVTGVRVSPEGLRAAFRVTRRGDCNAWK